MQLQSFQVQKFPVSSRKYLQLELCKQNLRVDGKNANMLHLQMIATMHILLIAWN